MMRLELTRMERIPDGVFGILEFPSGQQLHTCEDDWVNNRPGESCIPPGIYRLERSWYYGGKYETFEICDVPGRSRILVHKGNTEEDVKGCVAVGLRRGWIRVPRDEDTGKAGVRKNAVVDSAEAFRRFMAALAGVDEAELRISWTGGLP